MKKLKKLVSLIVIGVVVLTLAGCSSTKKESESAKEDKITIKLGVVGENNEQWTPVINKLKDEGITLELVKFADYAQPNQALADGEINLNSFQHYAYLNKEVKDKGFKIEAIGETIIAPLGLYSKKVKDVKEIKNGATIAIPNDATNDGRSLKVLEAAGLIKVDEKAGYQPTLKDITENPLNIKFVEVEAAQTPRTLEDVDAAIINGGYALDAGLYPQTDSIYLESVDKGSNNPYINVIVARSDEKNNENYKKVVEAFRSDEVAKVINETYKGSYIPTWK